MSTLKGELTLQSLRKLLPEADAQAAAGTLDLSGITTADSAGLAYLLELQRRAAERGTVLRFTQPPEQLLALARFFKLESAIGSSAG